MSCLRHACFQPPKISLTDVNCFKPYLPGTAGVPWPDGKSQASRLKPASLTYVKYLKPQVSSLKPALSTYVNS
jgi:hypothetical protein